MPVTTKVPLGAPTLARKWCVDIIGGVDPTFTYTGVFGISEFKNIGTPTFQDSSDYDGEGYKSQNVTAQEWGAEFKVVRKVTADAPDAYDPGQEIIRLAANEMGLGNTIRVRIYEDNGATGPMVEAYEGNVGCSWEPDGGAMDANETVSVKLVGQGKRLSIAHPGAA